MHNALQKHDKSMSAHAPGLPWKTCLYSLLSAHRSLWVQLFPYLYACSVWHFGESSSNFSRIGLDVENPAGRFQDRLEQKIQLETILNRWYIAKLLRCCRTNVLLRHNCECHGLFPARHGMWSSSYLHTATLVFGWILTSRLASPFSSMSLVKFFQSSHYRVIRSTSCMQRFTNDKQLDTSLGSENEMSLVFLRLS